MFPRADYHLHTHNSTDSTASMESMIESALSKGLTDICFTDHLDLDYPHYEDLPEDAFDLDAKAYHKEISFYRDKYKDRIHIGYGVEVGMQTHIAKDNSDYVRSEPFDFVIASIHLINRKDPYYPDFWDGVDPAKILKEYFELTLENLKLFDDYDVLGHLDYLTRYVPDGDNSYYSYQRYSKEIDAILLHIIKNDKGLDLNSKPIFKGGTDPNPHRDVLKRYKELGGKIITFGSDAHKPEGVAGSFDVLKEIALSCGFDEYCTYSGRNVHFHKL